MAKQYSEVSIYVGSEYDGGLYIKTDTFEGSAGHVELFSDCEDGDGNKKSIGYFEIDQLINALNIIKGSNLEYVDDSK